MKTNVMFVSLIAVLAIVLVATFVSADLHITPKEVYVDGIKVTNESGMTNVALVAGDTIPVKVLFKANENAEDVEISAWFSGYKSDKVEKALADLISGKRYYPALALEVPSDVEPEEKLTLHIRIDSDAGSEEYEYGILIQRAPYDLEIVSVDVDSRVEAGEKVPVEVVVKNTGRHELDDVFVVARIAELGIEKKIFLGDVDELDECWDLFSGGCSGVDDDDWEDAVSGKTTLKIPSDVDEGVYELEIIAYNEDTEVSKVGNILVVDTGASEVLVPSSSKTVAVNEEAIYELILVNAGDELRVFNLEAEGVSGVDVTADTIAVVPAGSSKIVKISAMSAEKGTYNFAVNVISGEEIIGTANLTANIEGSQDLSNPVVVLSIVLAIIFVVLLIVLIVLLTRKPEKEEEFSESYY